MTNTITDRVKFTPERLRRLFEPRSIVLIGASEKSTWSWNFHNILHDGHFTGPIYYVNPRGEPVHGVQTYRRLSDIGAPVDLALVIVPPAATLGVFQEMAEAGIHNAVLITAGFGEMGEEGKKLEQQLAEFALEHDIAIIGPNCLGFINVTAGIPAMPSFFPAVHPGGVAVIAQSGALTGTLFNYAYAQNVGISTLVSTGNEMVLTVSELIDYFVEDENTKVIALFVEAIRHPHRFEKAARHALERGKPVIALKIGRSEKSAQVAQAHTGAFVGDDRIIDVMFRQLGVIRVNSIDELLVTAEVAAQTGVLPGRRFGFVSLSGGASDTVADYAEQNGLSVPDFIEVTNLAITSLIPAITSPHNPLDTTGVVVNNPMLFEQVLTAVGQDSNIDFLICGNTLPTDDTAEHILKFQERLLGHIGKGLLSAKCPGYLMDFVGGDVTKTGRGIIKQLGVPLLPGGMERGIAALGKLATWSDKYRQFQELEEAETLPELSPVEAKWSFSGNWSEFQARTLLEQYQVPLIPATLVASAEQAAAAAQQVGFPVVLKIASPDIQHKSDIGGVKLGLKTEAEVSEAFEQIMNSVQSHAPDARLEGILVSPMRSGGVELLVGVVKDPSWGQVLAVGLGGIWVELFKDVSMRVLPITRREARAMLEELKGVGLLRGARGTKSADMEKLTDTILQIATVAQSHYSELESLEINPLRVDGTQIEALDALLSWHQK